MNNPIITHAVIGPPGTGKTTYVARQVAVAAEKFCANGEARHDTSPVLVVSLTRAAAAEAAGRNMPIPRSAVGTLHGHAYRAAGCPPIVTRDMIDDWNRQNSNWQLTPETFPAPRSAKSTNLSAGAQAGGTGDAQASQTDDLMGRRDDDLLGDYCFRELELHRHRMGLPAERLDGDDWPEIELFAAAWQTWKNENGLIDFTDMIEFAPPSAPMSPSVIFVDEAQDMSRLEWSLLRAWTTSSARHLVCVGDPYQALYDWRGADPDYLLGDRFADRTILHQSYRVPQAVHAAAFRWIRRLRSYQPIEYLPRVHGEDPVGRVDDLDATINDPEQAIDLARSLAVDGSTVMLAASCGYMLDPMIEVLRQRGVPFANPWRVRNGRWNPLRASATSTLGRIKSLCAPLNQRGLWTWQQLHEALDLIAVEGVLVRGAKKTIAGNADACTTDVSITEGPVPFEQIIPLFTPAGFAELWSAVESESVTGYLAWLNRHVTSSKTKSIEYPCRVLEANGLDRVDPKIYVGTIHSFKGGEADHVILFPDLSPKANKVWRDGTDGADAIIRTFYVGMTRAKRSLHLCDPARRYKHGAVAWG